MTLAIDPASRPRGRITFGVDQVRPPSVVFASIASLWTGWPLPGITKRAQTAYATPACTGSAVNDPLSGNVCAVRAVSATGGAQCVPPSLDVVADELARTYTRSSAPMDTHGSVTRNGSLVPVTQNPTRTTLRRHVRPPSLVVATMTSRAAWYPKRSCWYAT